MCFELKKGSRTKVARKDIECYKVFRIEENNILRNFNNWCGHPVVIYEKGIPAKKVSFMIFHQQVEEGYHSTKTLYGAKNYKSEYGWHNGIVKKCIIPKGTRYCENITQYVSETIILQ